MEQIKAVFKEQCLNQFLKSSLNKVFDGLEINICYKFIIGGEFPDRPTDAIYFCGFIRHFIVWSYFQNTNLKQIPSSVKNWLPFSFWRSWEGHLQWSWGYLPRWRTNQSGTCRDRGWREGRTGAERLVDCETFHPMTLCSAAYLLSVLSENEHTFFKLIHSHLKQSDENIELHWYKANMN